MDVFRSHAVCKRNTIDVAHEEDASAVQEYAGHNSVQITLEHSIWPETNDARDIAATSNASRRKQQLAEVESGNDELDDMRRLFGLDE